MEFDFMRKEDIEQIARLEKMIFPDPWSEQAFLNELENGCIYVVVRDCGNVVGYGGMWHIVDEGHIANIAVHPQYRRRHIACQILTRLEETARKKSMCLLTLEVRQSNTAAQNLYTKHKFEIVGRRTRYYSNNEDAIIMTKMLR